MCSNIFCTRFEKKEASFVFSRSFVCIFEKNRIWTALAVKKKKQAPFFLARLCVYLNQRK